MASSTTALVQLPSELLQKDERREVEESEAIENHILLQKLFISALNDNR